HGTVFIGVAFVSGGAVRPPAVNSNSPIPSGRGCTSAGVENACTPRPGSTRTMLNAHAFPADGFSPHNSVREIAASMCQPVLSLWIATNQRGFQVKSPQQSSHTQP